MSQPVVLTFFHGSYINRDVLREVDLVPEPLDVARPPGHGIETRRASADDVHRRVRPARDHGFASWYIERLESVVPEAPATDRP